MELEKNVRAVGDEKSGWEFRYTGDGILNCMNDAFMERVGCGYVVCIPFFGSTKNQMFKDRDSAFKFINNFILRSA